MILSAPVLLILLVARPEVIAAPPSIPHEQGSVVAWDENRKERWSAQWTMEPAQENGRPAVRFTENGSGLYSPFTQPVRWTIEAVWSAERNFYPLRFEKTVTDMNGRAVATERKVFDPAKRTVRFERKREGRSVEVKDSAAPSDTLTVEGIAGILGFLRFEQWRPSTVHFFTNEPRLYEMKIEMRGKERVTTPAGAFEAYRMELVPNLGLLNVVRTFLPKAHFWFSATAPHFWVRYEGPENGPGTPHIVMELKARSSGN